MIEYMKERDDGLGFDFDHQVLQTLSNKKKVQCINDFIQAEYGEHLEVEHATWSFDTFAVFNINTDNLEALITCRFGDGGTLLQFCNPNLDKYERMNFEVMAEEITDMFNGSTANVENRF